MTLRVKGFGMDCEQSLALLSELHDGTLSDPERMLVLEHLLRCLPCHKIFYELRVIVTTAHELNSDAGFSFPDENVLWQRLSISMRSA